MHTTPGIPQYMHPVIALVTAAVKWTFWDLPTDKYTTAEREAVVHAHRAAAASKKNIQAFYDGIKDKPETTFGNVNR